MRIAIRSRCRSRSRSQPARISRADRRTSRPRTGSRRSTRRRAPSARRYPPMNFHQLNGFKPRASRAPSTSRLRNRASYSENSRSPYRAYASAVKLPRHAGDHVDLVDHPAALTVDHDLGAAKLFQNAVRQRRGPRAAPGEREHEQRLLVVVRDLRDQEIRAVAAPWIDLGDRLVDRPAGAPCERHGGEKADDHTISAHGSLPLSRVAILRPLPPQRPHPHWGPNGRPDVDAP